MVPVSELSSFKVPVYCEDEVGDIRKTEIEANKALKRIQSLYEEIMTPSTTSLYDVHSSENSYLSDSSETSSTERHYGSREVQKHKPLCELCNKCKKYFSHCDSCSKFKHKNISRTAVLKHSKGDYLSNQLRNHIEFSPCKENYKQSVDSNSMLKVTIPEPFPLTFYDAKRQEAKELKMSKLKEELNSKIEKELKVKVQSKAVPKHTHLPLYKDMVKRNEKKRLERKEKCLEIYQNVKPFHLSTSEISCYHKCESLPCDYSKRTIKAKPVPKSVISNEISEKLRNKEEIRKILIAQRAEELLKRSSLPFSRKNINKAHSMIDMDNFKSKSNAKDSKPKNIAAITRRLYTKKCQDTMEDWNKKVEEIRKWKDEISDKGKNVKKSNFSNKKCLIPDQALPFFYFPVRMSNAAMLREKQIRAEILARRRREEEEVNAKEEIVKKEKEIQNNLVARLKNCEPPLDTRQEIQAKIKSFRATQLSRQHEYEKELQEIMDRVSHQLLLVERQSKKRESCPDKIVHSSESASDGQQSVHSESDSFKEAESASSSIS